MDRRAWSWGQFRLTDNNDTPETIAPEVAELVAHALLSELPRFAETLLRSRGLSEVLDPEGRSFDIELLITSISVEAKLVVAEPAKPVPEV
jgi:hypothetical protein